MGILNELENLMITEDDDYDYYRFRFDFKTSDVPTDNIEEFITNMSGEIDAGNYGKLEDVTTKNYDDIYEVSGILRTKQDVEYSTNNESVQEIVLEIYNNQLQSIYEVRISGVEVDFDEETENFEVDE